MKRNTALLLAALLLAPGPGWTQQQATDEEVQPRVIWGILIKVALSQMASASWDLFTNWLQTRVPEVTDTRAPNLALDSGARVRPRSSSAVATRSSSDGSTAGNPTAPVRADAGQMNYQGAHVALAVASPDGKEFAYRPILYGFKTGERFKLRVVSTFGGELTLENINPKGERKHIYPPNPEQVVVLQAGKETFLPLGKDEFFEFTKSTGREQLVVNLADPRAVGNAASREKVYRQDVKYGSNFLQQVAPNTYPRISQAIELTHSR